MVEGESSGEGFDRDGEHAPTIDTSGSSSETPAGKDLGNIRETFGAFVHSHGQMESLHTKYPEFDEAISNQQDARVYFETTLSYLDEIGGDESPLALVDTDHAAHILGIPVGSEFPANPDEMRRNISEISRLIAERGRLVKEVNASGEYNTRIFSGVEVDILNSEGLLDATNESLDTLDLVIASQHPDEFRKVNGEFTKESAMNAYLSVVGNKSIDVLGHPTRHLEELTEEIGGLPSLEEWDPILQTMKDNQVAYEINIRSLSITEYDLSVIKRANEIGCDFSIGFDFHHFERFNDLGRHTSEEIRTSVRGSEGRELTPAEEKILKISDAAESKNDAEREKYFREELTPQERGRLRFMESKGQPNVELFMRLRNIIKTLKAAGIKKDSVINTSPEKLEGWLEEKHREQESQ